MSGTVIFAAFSLLLGIEQRAHACGTAFEERLTPEQLAQLDENAKNRLLRASVENTCAFLREKEFYDQALAKGVTTSPEMPSVSVSLGARAEKNNRKLAESADQYRRIAGEPFSDKLCEQNAALVSSKSRAPAQSAHDAATVDTSAVQASDTGGLLSSLLSKIRGF